MTAPGPRRSTRPVVRAQFPALAGDWVFLDNAGGRNPAARRRRISDYLLTSNVQLGAATPYLAVRAGERMQEAQRRTAELVNAERPEEVVMGPTSTLLVQLLARGDGASSSRPATKSSYDAGPRVQHRRVGGAGIHRRDSALLGS